MILLKCLLTLFPWKAKMTDKLPLWPRVAYAPNSLNSYNCFSLDLIKIITQA